MRELGTILAREENEFEGEESSGREENLGVAIMKAGKRSEYTARIAPAPVEKKQKAQASATRSPSLNVFAALERKNMDLRRAQKRSDAKNASLRTELASLQNKLYLVLAKRAQKATRNQEDQARALQVAGARPAPRADQDRADGDEKPFFYDAGRILGRISRLYGYSLLIAGIHSIFMSGVSLLPLTKWDGEEGVPRADVILVSLLLKLWICAGVSFESRERSVLTQIDSRKPSIHGILHSISLPPG